MDYFLVKATAVSEFLMGLEVNSKSDRGRVKKLLLKLEKNNNDQIYTPLIQYVSYILHRGSDEVAFDDQGLSPVEVMKKLMNENGHLQKDLVDVAPRTVICEILSGKRKLNLGQVERLAKKYQVSPTLFMEGFENT